MFKWLSNIEQKAMGTMQKVMSSQMASTVMRGAKGFAGAAAGYALTHVSNPASLASWETAFVAGAILAAEKYISYNQSQQ